MTPAQNETAQAQEIQSQPVILGYRDFNHGTDVTGDPTEAKPESKLWHHDGFWWGVLWNDLAAEFRIHRFDPATQNWTNVGPTVDTRRRSAADVFVDGSKVYIASRAKINVHSTDSKLATLARYTYSTGSKAYSLDSGFPVDIPGTDETEALTIARDSAGKIWAVWTRNSKIRVNSTNGSDTSWGTDFVLPVQGNDLAPDDIAALTAFDGNKIGVFWSNQIDAKMYFAVHLDANDSTTWQPRETALENGAKVADDHLNLAVRESDGTLIAISKTSLTGADSPYMYLNIRNPGTGVWTNTVVWRRREDPTRPMVVLNSTTDSVYVISRLKPEGGIFYKATHLSNPSFAEGNGRLLIKSFTEDVVNNPTSTKQSVTNSTGLLVLTSDKGADTYMHGYLPFDNQHPIVNPDSAFSNEETPVTISVTSNDSDPDGSLDISSIAVVHGPQNGTAQVLVGEIVYTPDPGFSGPDSLFYTLKDNDGTNGLAAVVNITVNDSPLALDDLASTTEDTPIDISILANDSDTDSEIDSASVTVAVVPANGIFVVNPANGVLTYTPNANFNGTDSLIYTVADDSGGVSNAATVTIAVSDVNDPPVAINDTVTTDNATMVTIDVLANDIEVDGTVSPGSVVMTALPLHGTATLNSATAEIEYTPDANFFGTDSLKYTETDDDGATSNVGTVFINVNSVPFAQNDTVVTEQETAAVIDILGNDNDPDGSLNPATVTIVSDVTNGNTTINPASGNVTYTPNPGFVGTDLFTYTVKDEGGVSSNLASVHIKVNDKPTAVNDTVLTLKGVAIDIAILDNDHDTDGTLDSSSITVLFGPFNGSLSINAATGGASYSPNALFSGTDIFEYQVQDNDGSVSNKATVSIRVNEPPVANPDAAITNEDTPVNIIVTPNDTDADGTVIETAVAVATPPGHGTANVNPATGVITYSPAQDYFGPDAFTYTVDDDNGTPSNAATVTVTINDINDPPVAVNDTVTTGEDQPFEIAVLANDLDIDGTPNATSVTTIANSALGTLSVHPVTGVITYTPHPNLFGQDSFTYTFLDDDNATSNSATVFVTISPVNDPPTAVDDNATTDEDNAVAIDILSNDSDNDGSIDETTVVVDAGPANGTTSVDPVTGLITYTPAADFFGTDTFTYTVDDNAGALSNSATVTVAVNDVNDAPIAVNDTARALFNEPFDIDVTANDLDIDGSIVPSSILASSGTHGSTSIKPSGEITYTPNQGFLGEDSFFYSVRDDDGAGSNTATVTVFVKVPPVAVNDTVVTNEDVALEIPVIANDSDLDGTLDPTTVTVVSPPSHGALVVNATTGSITYTPSANYNGPDSFQYTVSDNDGVASNVATVAITVNKAPFALNDNRTVDEDMPIDIDVSANDVDLDGTIDPTTVTLLSQPGNGTTSLNQSTGVVTYTPNPNFSGSDGFTYIVQDNNGVSTNAATVTITVTPVNDPPVAGNDVVSTNKATPIDIDITANDVDIDGTIVEASVTITAQPGNGNVSVDPTSGVVTYQPHAFFLGVDTFVYTIQDNNGAVSNFATVTINVSGDNDPPTAVNDTASTTEDLALLINVVANDIDLDGTIDGTTVTILTNPVNGTASVSPVNGAITYQPVFDFFGEDSLTYQVKDNLGAISNEARVFITVFNVNDMPVALSDTAATDEDTPVTINIVLNDTDSDGTLDLASVAIVDDPDHGATSLNTTTGEVTYTPEADFFGEDSLKYTIRDNDGGTSNPATILVTVNDVNDLPVAIGDTTQTSINVAINIAVTANDSDIDGTIDPATVEINTPPGNGTTNILPNGVVTYTPNQGFGGVDGFIYSVKDDDGALSNPALVTVTIVAPPTAVKDSVATDEDVAIEIAVLGNDSDVDGSIVASSVTVASGPGTGQANVNTTTGRITYTPANDFFGEDSFTYTVEDNDGNLSDAATVKVTVLPVNDLPVARDDTVATPEDTPVAIAVTANDSDVDGSLNVGTLTVTGGPTNGQATVNTSTGQITYTPNPNYNGPDVFTYVVQDNDGGTSNEASVNLTVTELNDLPIAADDAATTNEDVSIAIDVASNDIDPDGSLNLSSVTVTRAPGHGTTTVDGTTGAITYTPAADFFGTDSLEYTIKDNLGVGSNAATVTLTVNPINDAPRTADDVAATSEDTPIAIAVTANDVDVDGTLNFSTLTITNPPGNGTVQVNPANGDVTYTPNLNFSGQDSLTYTIKDNTGLLSNEAKVTISISNENDPPLARDDTATTDEETPVVVAVTTNDSDVDGSLDLSTVTVTSGPGQGAIVINPTTGEITYTPADNFFGEDSLKYTVEDDLGASSNVARVSLMVNPVNDAPVAANDTTTTPEDTPVTIAVTQNDSDVDGSLDGSTVTVISGPANGGTTINTTTGEITYTPAANFNGQDTFTYSVQDNEGATSNDATVVVTVSDQNDPPVAQDDSVSTDEEAPLVIDVAANDSDDTGLNLTTVSIGTPPTHGTASVSPATGEITYTPAENFFGPDSLRYTIRDDLDLISNVARVTITVNPVNDLPLAQDDNGSTVQGLPVDINVLTNDSDVDGTLQPGSVVISVAALNGTTTINPLTGVITYTPNSGFVGTDEFSYTVNDNDGGTSNIATVSITVTAPQMLTFQSIHDGQVKVTAPGNNYGFKATTKVEAGKFISYFKFVVSGVTGQIQSAKVVLQVTNGVSDGGDSGGSIFLVSNDFLATNTPWIEQALTSGNAPEITGSALSTLGAVTPNQVVEFDVTNAVNGDGTFSFAVSPNSGNQVKYYTKEGTAPPKLVIATGTGGQNSPPVAVNDNATAAAGLPLGIDVTANDTDSDGTVQVTTVTVVSQPANGTASVNPSTGVVTYTPNTGFGGTDTFTYTVQDDDGATSNAATVTVEVLGGNTPPVAVNDTSSTTATTPAAVDVTANDTDSDGTVDVTTVAIATPPANGTASVSASTGVVTYTPNTGFGGTDTFTYTVQDDDGAASNAATVTVEVLGGNTPPVAVNDNTSTAAATPVLVDVTANDTDSDGTVDVTTVAIVTPPANGTATANSITGVVTYAPAPGFSGTDTFTYTVNDDAAATSNAATVTVTVQGSGGSQSLTFSPIDDGQVKLTDPGANYGTKATMKVDGGKFSSYMKFNVTGVGTPIQSAKVRLRVTDAAKDGGDNGGSIFLVDNNFAGTGIPWVEETLTSGNAPPATGSPLSTLGPISASQTVELDVTGAVTGNGIVSFAVVPNSTNGVKYYTKEGIARPELIVTTGSGGSSNNPPVAVNDNGATVADTPVAVDVTANDTDSDGTIVVTTVAIVSQPLNGSVSVNNATGVVTYSPNAGFSGTDTFTYTVKDDDGATSNAATVTVQVLGSNVAPVATDDNANTTAGNAVAIDVTANDSDSDGTINVSTVAIGTAPTNGSTTVSGLTGVVTYTPDAGFNGTDTFTYTVKDDDGANSNEATVSVSVAGGGTGGTFTFESTDDGQVKLTAPGSNYGTKATMKVDGGKFSSYLKFVVSGISGAVQSARVRLRVTDAPADGGDNGGSMFLVDNNFSGVGIPWVEQTLTSGNAPAATGSPLSTLGAVAPSQTVEFDVSSAVNGNGTFSFAIVPNSTNGVKYFTKEGSTAPQLVITTGSGGSGNAPPVAVNDNAATTAGNPVPIDVTANDSDSDGTLDVTTVTIISPPANGGTSVNATFGFVTYTPNVGFGGTDTFTYTVRDDAGAQSNAATVTVQVIGGNQAPVANADNGTTTAGNSVALDVAANDTDSDGTLNVTTVTVVTPPGNGTATVNSGTGVVTYTPSSGFEGTDTFTYTVNDDDGATSNAATVTVTVQPDGGGSGGTFTFEPTDDGQVKLTNAGLNYGSKATMKVDGSKFSSYLKFVVSGVTGSVQSAKVRLRVTDAATDGGDNGGSIFLTSNNFAGIGVPWVEETLTSGNAPAATGSALSTLGPISASQTVAFDVSGAVHGNGTFSFVIAPNSTNGVKYFTKEGTAGPELVVVTGAGGGGNTAPVAVNDNSATTAGTPVAIDVTANDSDSDGTIVVTTVAIGTPPGNGTATVSGTGVVTYTPSVGFSGTDTFAYTVQDDDGAISNAATVSVVVTAGNQPPVASNDNANAVAGTPISIDVTVNDTDSDGTIDVTTVAIVAPPGNGSAVVSTSTGVVTYTPNAGFSGSDSFSYSVKDDDGATSNVATVTVSVAGGSQTLTFAPSHDGQVKLSDPGANYGSKGTMKVERGKFSSYLKFVVSGVTGTVQSAILRLRVTVDPGDGSDQGGSIFQASNNFTGTATPWVEGTLTSANAPDVISGALSTLGPVAENTLVDLDVSGAVAGNGTFSFCITSNSGNQVKYYTKEGTTTPQLIVQTGAGTTIVKGENAAPSAVDDAMTTKPGVAVAIDVLANDLDVDGKLATSTVSPVTSPSSGKVRVDDATGVLVYTPHPGFIGTDSFNYIVYDEQGRASNPAQVVVTVNESGNAAPRATDDDATTYASVAVSIPVTANDSDSDGAVEAASIAILTPAAYGTVRLDGERGIVIYHPDKGFVGSDKFTYQIRDDSGALSNIATVKISVKESMAQLLAFLPTDDAFVRASSPTDNFGAVSELRATNGTAEFYSFMKFNVSGLTGAVQRATLRLFIAGDDEGGEVYAVSNTYRNSETAWQEDGLVWDNAPEISGAPLASFDGDGKGRYVEIDVTAAVQGENVFSFGLSGHGSETATYESKEGAHPPELIVETGEAAEGPSSEVTEAATGSPNHLPDAITLSPNYPNPFNPETNILYALPQDAKVKLEIYNVRGQLVRTLVNEVQTAGFKRIRWQGNDSSGILVGSGVYFMRLQVGSQKFSRRIILQK